MSGETVRFNCILSQSTKINFVLAYQDQLVESEPIQKYIEERLRNSTYMSTKDYEVEQTTRLTPETFTL